MNKRKVLIIFCAVLLTICVGRHTLEDKFVEASSLNGSKISICGDSISTFTGYIPEEYRKFYPEKGEIYDVNDTWWKQVIDKTGLKLCENASFSGSTVAVGGGWRIIKMQYMDVAINA